MIILDKSQEVGTVGGGDYVYNTSETPPTSHPRGNTVLQ